MLHSRPPNTPLMASSTVLSLWLPARDADEDAVEAGAVPDIFRVRVPHQPEVEGGELTRFQKDVVALAQQDVRELHLVINKHKPYGKAHAHLNSLSKASCRFEKRCRTHALALTLPAQEISTLYNEWAEMGADAEEEGPDEEGEEDYEEGDEEDEEDDDDEDVPSPPHKKSKRGSSAEAQPAATYVMPVATSLSGAAATVLAPRLNMARAEGETKRIQPYYGTAGEHYVVVNVVHGDDEE